LGVCLGEGEERDQVGVDDLRWKAIEPLAFRLAEEPDRHDDLLLRRSAWMIRQMMSASASGNCKETVGFEKAVRRDGGWSVSQRPD
jgi:hypothetical protein